MISDLGYGAFFFFGAVLVLMGVWAFFFVPETKGVTLEEMDALFARPVALTVWRQMRGRSLDLDDGSKRSSSDVEEKVAVQDVEHDERKV